LTLHHANDNRMDIPTWTNNTRNRGVVGASMFDNSNLILSDNGHKILWDNSHTPTNTLLGKRLEMSQIVKASSKNVIASYYNLDMAETGKLVLRWCSEVIYRKSGTKG
jgi:hypothetical protein